TEKVGNETWHRGMLDGKQVWIKATDLEAAKGTRTSRLGHIKSRNVLIYEWIGGRSFSAGTEYTNHVYYIKLEKMVGSQKYYLISKSPSSINGVVGWVKEQDMDSYEHITVDNKEKVFYLNGNGRATTKAWGGKKDAVYDPLKDFEGKLIFVNLTEKVGTNIWYRGKINDNGPNVWVHANWVTKTYETYVHYNLTIQQAVQIQRQSAINTIWKNGEWITANEKEIEAYLNPTNFINDEIQRFQFLDLSKRSGAPEHILRAHLQGKGVLSGQEKA